MAQKTMNVKVHGIEKLKRNIRKCQKAFYTQLENICREAAEKIRDDAKSRVPVDTGRLQENIMVDTVEITKNGVNIGIGVKGGQQGETFYWYFVEYGHQKDDNYPAQPFLRPAFDENEEEVKRMIKKGVMEMLERILD